MIRRAAVTGIILLIAVSLTFGILFNMPKLRLPLRHNESIVLKVAGDSNFPPYEFVDENDEYTGFNVDIMRAIALSSGIDIQFYPMTWAEACEKLQYGEVDIIEGMKYTSDRDKYYDFSEEYLENSQSIFVLSGNESIHRFEDLASKRVAIQQGDVAVANLNSLENVNILYTTDQEQAINKLLNNEADAYIGNTLAGVFLTNKKGIRDKIKIAGKTLNPTKYSIAVKDGDAETLRIINKGLKEIKKNGTYDKIYRKWFGQPVNFPSWYIPSILYSAGVIALLFIIAMLLLYRWNSTLKKEVERQTREINEANNILINKNIQIEQERDFREQVLNNIFSGVITINKEGIITFANILAERILDAAAECLIGKHYTDTPVKYIFSQGYLTKDNEEKELTINGRKQYLSFKVRLLQDPNDNMEETIVIFRDITEEKLMQESIRTKDKLQSLGNLMSGIAHEIRNPLTSIKTYAELIPKKFENPKFREMVSKDIPSEIDRLDGLISDLLEYSRPRKPFKERINLYQSVNSVILLLKNKTEKEKVSVENNVGRDVFIEIDKNQFRQVLINILLNAIESMDKRDKSVVISVADFEDTISLSIEDNGCGIDEDEMGKLFNPFYTTKAEGTGIGLFVSYQLLSENNAGIKCESIAGKGTKFTIQFKTQGDDLCGEAFNS